MPDRLSDAELVHTLQVVDRHETKKAACATLGINARALTNRLTDASNRGLTKDTPVRDELEKTKAALKAAKRDIALLQKEHDTEETIRTRIYELSARSPEPPAWLTPAKPALGKRGVPVCLWSDWHFGETVDPIEVGGMNTFNAEVAADRVRRLVNTTVDLCFNHMGRADTDYPGVVICLGGDMISGDIHEELFATNDRTTQQCINELTDILASALEEMADKFGRVFVAGVVGNHGRASRKPRMKGRVHTSHEWNIYCNLERHFRKDKRFVFLIPGETDAYFKVYNHRFLLTHGDSLGVKGGDGIIGALGPIMRGSIKVRNSEVEIGRKVDTILMGHWHQMLWLPGAIVNGALKGYDEYARLALRAPYSRPSQALFFVHPEHGITAKWEVFLDSQKNAKEADWLAWKDPSAPN